ncbi:MAG TPA: M48 family metallopeptidase [Polyangiaceae bacterium]|jgi:predicted Zn-dependent protease|nr:M48 family metallopeptidase [Polyangiaceae bacterium]
MRCTCADKGDLGRHLAGLSALALLAVACATSATGRKQLLLMPDDEVRGMGEQAFVNVKKESPAAQEPVTNAYVQCVVGALLQVIGAKASDWEVVVFEDDSANAFALPGGKVGVYTGILKVAKNQDQLAAVVGHEIAHVTQRHGNERVSQAFVAENGLAAASAALGGSGKEHDLAMSALGVGAQYGALMPFGRTQESEADAIGLDYMARAGFDPQGAVALWQNMSEATGEGPPEFLSTHPSHQTRISDIQKRLPSAVAESESARAKGDAPHCTSPASPGIARAD